VGEDHGDLVVAESVFAGCGYGGVGWGTAVLAEDVRTGREAEGGMDCGELLAETWEEDRRWID